LRSVNFFGKFLRNHFNASHSKFFGGSRVEYFRVFYRHLVDAQQFIANERAMRDYTAVVCRDKAGVTRDDLVKIFASFKSYFPSMSPESAEVMKISLNCFVTTKIAYANMIRGVADQTPGANKDDILHAIGHDSRVGTKYLRRDNRALAGYADRIGHEVKISKATDNANDQHIAYQAQQ
jgi:UDP-glucose 6-dehydrogenase